MHDPARGPAGQQRADRDAQLVQQPGRGQLAQQPRAALGQDPPVATAGQGPERRAQVGVLVTRDDHFGALTGPVTGAGRCRLGSDHDGARVCRGRGQQRAVQVQVQPGGEHRDGRRGRAPGPQPGPAGGHPGRPVSFRPGGARADQDHIGQRPEQAEDLTVGRAGQAAGPAAQLGGAVQALDHVGPHPGPASQLVRGRVGVPGRQVSRPARRVRGMDLAHRLSARAGQWGRPAGPAQHHHGARRHQHGCPGRVLLGSARRRLAGHAV